MQKVIEQACKVVLTEINTSLEQECALLKSEMREFIMNIGFDMESRLYAIKVNYVGVDKWI